MLGVAHQQMNVVNEQQLTFHSVKSALVHGVNPLVILRGINFLDARISEDTILEELLMHNIDEVGLSRTRVTEYEHVHLWTCCHTTLTLTRQVEAYESFYLLQNRVLTDGRR